MPDWELDRLSVGYARVARVLGEHTEALLAGEAMPPLFVDGEWGSGKTHLLEYLHWQCAKRGAPIATVVINAHSAALNHPQRFFQKLAGSICCGTQSRGLRSTLVELLESEDARIKLRLFAKTSASGDIQLPILELCDAWEAGGRLELLGHGAFFRLLGGDLTWSDYAYKREQALQRIASIALMLRAVGRGGLCLVFDEVETIDQLWNVRSRLNAYNVIGRLIRMKGVWAVFSITKRFRQAIDADMSIVEPALTSEGRAFWNAWRHDQYEVMSPPRVDLEAARQLAKVVADLYQAAHGTTAPVAELDRWVDIWRSNPGHNPRRLLRALVNNLDLRNQLVPGHGS